MIIVFFLSGWSIRHPGCVNQNGRSWLSDRSDQFL